MNVTGCPPVAAVVLGAGGGARLARTLESVAWAAERVVVDPAGGLAGADLPPDVHRAVTPPPAGPAPWVLLVAEGERVSPALRAAIATALAAHPPGAVAWRVARDVGVLGATFRPLRPVVRLAARPAPVRVRRDGGVELRPPPGPVGRLAPPLEVAWAGDLGRAVAELDADAALLAALLDAAGRRPGAAPLVAGALAAAARTFVARAPRAPLPARWGAAVLAGYRVAVAQAKLWERRRRLPEAAA